MKELKKLINDTIAAFLAEMEKNVTDGNRPAGRRARKLSIELENLFRCYRRESMKRWDDGE